MSLPSKLWIGTILLLSTAAAVASPRTAVLDNKLNLRAGPGLDKRVVVVMPAGATVTVGECRGEWCAIAYRIHRGFVSSALVKGGALLDSSEHSSIVMPRHSRRKDGVASLAYARA